MRTSLWIAAILACASCSGDTTDPSAVSLTGQWQAVAGTLGIGEVDLNLTETESQLTGTGTYTSNLSTLEPGDISVLGIHIAAEINATLRFTAPTDSFTLNMTGHVDDENHFVLIFPGDAGVRVTFTRR